MNNQIDNQEELNKEQLINQSNEIKIKLEKIDNVNNELIKNNLLEINNKLINDEINNESNQELNNLNKDKINENNFLNLDSNDLNKDKINNENNLIKSANNELKLENDELNLDKINEDLVKEEIKPEEDEDESLKDNCENHVNFAIICSFFQQFGTQIGVNYSIETLKEMLENNKKIEDNLIELHVKLLRKIKKYVNKDRWENGLVKFLNEFSSFNDALELESTGYQKISLKFKIDLLKLLLEAQFDFNQKFKSEINNIETLLLRLVPIGRDLNGNQYWYHLDEEHTLRIYREQPNKNKDWKLICIDKDQFTQLIDEVENCKTEICDLSGERTLSENSDQEEEQSKQKNKSSKKNKRGRNKSKQQSNSIKNNSNKIVNGFKEEDNDLNSKNKDLIVNNININEDNKQQLTPIKEERKGRRGRRSLNRSFISTPTLDKIKEEEDDDNENSRSSNNRNDNVEEEDIDLIVKQTITSLLNKIDDNNNNITKSSNRDDKQKELLINNNQQQFKSESKIDDQEQKEDEIKVTTKSRGRKKKNPLNELSKLLGDNAPKNLEDLMPIKRSSRIQKLQEKRSAELKLQMEIEQQKKMEEINKAKLTKKIIEKEQERNYQKTDDDDDTDEEYQEPVKSRKNKNMDTSDTDNEFSSSVKKKKKKGRKNKEKIKEKKSNKLKKWSSNDELDELYQYEEEEEDVLKFDDNNDEFACELEEDGEPVILKRARTARKAKTDDNEEELDNECINDDTPCQKCSLYSNPEWILLCDNCNLGYHTDCLIPKLYLIPDGDWYCPKCENEQLLTKLKFEFENYVSNLAKREREQIRKERLKYVEINIGNILGEESANRKRLSNKKKFEDYDSDLDDSDDLIDESDESDDDSNGRRRTRKRNYNDDSSDYDSDDSNSISHRKRNSSQRRTNSNRKQANRRSRPVQRVSHKPKQRKRRLSYSDQTDSDEVSGSELSSQESNDNSQSDSSSQPKQRSARKKVSYQFKEYDELINSAIQASDYDEYEENEEDEEDDEEEDSDNGKSPYSKGKDISNLMSATNPFETENNDEISMKTQINNELVVNNVNIDAEKKIEISPLLVNTQQKEKSDENDGDERTVVTSETKKKGKLKGKRKLNDLDSPVEEAENDSDFTIKEDESVTEIDDEDLESNDYSNETDLSDDTDLSDWGKKSRRHNTRNRSSNKKRNKKRRRFDSDESDYGYKTRRKSKRVTYRELSTTEEEEEDYDDWSDNSEKQKKNKKNKSKKKKISDESDLTNELTDSQEDERTVLKKKKSSNKKIKKDHSDEEKDDFNSEEEEEEEEGKRKSKRTQKKKVYNDYTDIDESDGDDKQLNENREKELNQDKVLIEEIGYGQEQKLQVDQSLEQQQILLTQNVTEVEMTVNPNPVEQPPVIKRAPKIKVTKLNPNLTKNKNLNSTTLIDLPVTALPTEKINLPEIDLNNPNLPSNLIAQTNPQINQQDIQMKNLNIPNIENSGEKKKRGRKPKDSSLKEVKDPNTPTVKRGRKPKTSLSNEQQIQSDLNQQPANLNNLNKPSSVVTNSALSQLTQFALESSSKLLPNNSLVDPANIKHLLAAELASKNIPILNSQLQEMSAKQVKASSKNKTINDLNTPSKTTSKSSSASIAPAAQPVSSNSTSSATATATKSNLNSTAHLLQNNLASVHFPPSTQTPNSPHLPNLTGQQHLNLINNGRQPTIPNHLPPQHPSMHQPQLPPNYALHGQNLHNLQAQHNLHNPYSPYPSPLAHQMANLPHHMQHPNPYALDPQFAANRFGFPPGYPPSFYNPSFPYFPHPNHQYNSYYNHPPQHPNVHQPPHQTPHLQPPPSQTHQSTTASLLPATTNSIPTTVKSSINTTQPNTTQSTNTTKTNNSSSTPAK